ncbi:MAG TPA: acyl carrier protein [Mycobacterium sp.]|nr:acyl carrier protein [Mycobacterium sp.]
MYTFDYDQFGSPVDAAQQRRQTKEHTMATTRPTYSALVDWLINRVADYLNTEPAAIATDVAIGDYGMDSVFALTLCSDLEYEFGIIADPTLAWDYPTIDAMAGYLTEELRIAS